MEIENKTIALGEAIGIPPHLSLSGCSIPASEFTYGQHALGHIENATKRQYSKNQEGVNVDTDNALRSR